MSRLSDRRITRAIGDAFAAHYGFEAQRRELETMRDAEGIDLDDAHIEELAWLDPASFARKADEVRSCYARRESGRHSGHSMGPVGAGSEVTRAIAHATQHRCSFPEALAAIGNATQ